MAGRQLDSSDLAVVGISTATELCLALVVFHVAANRGEASYAAKAPGLAVCTALAVSGSFPACCVGA